MAVIGVSRLVTLLGEEGAILTTVTGKFNVRSLQVRKMGRKYLYRKYFYFFICLPSAQ